MSVRELLGRLAAIGDHVLVPLRERPAEVAGSTTDRRHSGSYNLNLARIGHSRSSVISDKLPNPHILTCGTSARWLTRNSGCRTCSVRQITRLSSGFRGAAQLQRSSWVERSLVGRRIVGRAVCASPRLG